MLETRGVVAWFAVRCRSVCARGKTGKCSDGSALELPPAQPALVSTERQLQARRECLDARHADLETGFFDAADGVATTGENITHKQKPSCKLPNALLHVFFLIEPA